MHHRVFLLALLSIHLCIPWGSASERPLVWPEPQEMRYGNTVVVVRSPLTLQFDASTSEALRFLTEATRRFNNEYSTGSLQPVTPIPQVDPAIYTELVHISVRDPSLDLGEGTDEGYTLDISASTGRAISISAGTVYGAIRALDTLGTLMIQGKDKGAPVLLPHAPYHIQDRPRFTHRGVMLDTARSYFPVGDILRTLDAMAWSKLNVFHWHIIDSQSFPLASEALPLLAAHGSYTPESIYTREDVAKIVRHARLRGIRVIPEFDAPGHTYIWSKAYPELVVCKNVQPKWDDVAAEPPSGQLDPTNPKSLALLRTLLTEQARWFPDAYVHVGGDEVKATCYERDPKIAAYLKNHGGMSGLDLIRGFARKFQSTARGLGKRVVTWEEAVLEYNVPMTPDTLVQAWKGSDAVVKLTGLGHQVITSPSDYWYLDCGRGEWVQADGSGKSWCDPYKDWMRVYSYDPVANVSRGEYVPSSNPSATNKEFAAHPLIPGGEVALWSEQADPVNLDTLLWPRSSAAAEVLWSGKVDLAGKARSMKAALVRILALRRRYVRRGIRADMIQMLWCEMHPGDCAMPE